MSYSEKIGWNISFPEALDSINSVIFVFAAPVFDEKSNALKELFNAFPQSHFFGCSSSHEIFGKSILEDSISVAVVKFNNTKIKIKNMPIESIELSYQTGLALGRGMSTDIHMKAAIVLADGLNVDASTLLKGLKENLPSHVNLSGGLASDGDAFINTWVLVDKKVENKFVSVLCFYGENNQVLSEFEGGWEFFGLERRVTKSKGNILYELNNLPALDLYKKYLGIYADELPESGVYFPLQICKETKEVGVIRAVIGVDEHEKSLIFAGDIPEGSYAKMMRSNVDLLIEGAAEAASSIANNLKKSQKKDTNTNDNSLVVTISCEGRKRLLGQNCEEELEAVLSELPLNTLQIGFYSYGEFSPSKEFNSCEFHNQTMTLTYISEEL